MDDSALREKKLTLDKDLFLRSVLRELMGTLEEVIGTHEASGYISIVGQNIGEWLNKEYREAYNTDQLDLEQIAETLVHLKKRIGGDFYVISADKDKIVLGNNRCPFGDKVKNRNSLCMMTSNVFGSIAAENNGYACVELKETIARGYSGCHVVVHLKQNNPHDNEDAREYFKSDWSANS